MGKKLVEVDGVRVGAETVVLAAGSRPQVPDLPGLDDVPYLTSDEALRLPAQPRRLLILGGGFIAAELAHFFSALGTRVTVVHRGPLLLRNEDEAVARRFTDVYRRKVDLVLGAQALRVRRHGEGVALDVAVDGVTRRLEADALPLAVGRRPNTDTLAVADTGVALDERGFVRTDAYLETNEPGIWALGDIVGRYLLKHSAHLEAAYTYADTAYGSSIEDRDGFVKALAHRETGEILGCHILGTDA